MSIRIPAEPSVKSAHQWWKTGDLDTVERFRVEEYLEGQIHPACGCNWNDHGVLQTTLGAEPVCPGDWVVEHNTPGLFSVIRFDCWGDDPTGEWRADCRDCELQIRETTEEDRRVKMRDHHAATSHQFDIYETVS